MEMTGEQRIGAPVEVVWRGLNDPDILRACIPGCQSLEVVGENRFRAAATIKVGPISARFGGEVQLSDLDPPNGYRITGEGSGGVAGSAKGGAQVSLAPDGDGTLLRYTADAEVHGRLAQLGGKLIDATAKQLAGMFFARFSEKVSAMATQPASADVAAPAMSEAGMTRPVAAGSTPASRPVEPVQVHGGLPLGWIFTVVAALLAGFILGRAATGEGMSGVVGMAVSLVAIASALAGFLFGRASPVRPHLIVLDGEALSRMAGPSRTPQP